MQRSRGFGFITFSSPDSVDRVLSVSSHSLDGKKIDPKHATPKSKSKANKTKKIFVGGVSQGWMDSPPVKFIRIWPGFHQI